MGISVGLAFVFAVLAAVFNGSFVVPFKLSAVAKYNIPPLVFLQYNCVGIFLSSWLCNAFLPLNSSYVENAGSSFQFVWLALLGGVIFAASLSCGFIAVEIIGLALAQGVLGGTAIVTSYLWATIVFGEYPSIVALSVFGVFVLVVGVFGIAMSQSIAGYIWKPQENAKKIIAGETMPDTRNPMSADCKESGLRTGKPSQMDISANVEEEADHVSVFDVRNSDVSPKISREKFMLGLAFSVMCGFFGGTGSFFSLYSACGFISFPRTCAVTLRRRLPAGSGVPSCFRNWCFICCSVYITR
jgi:multidrug transporter EmrE-like cation transporter